MTTMEQGLRYIEREIRFMVKDQFGNSTYTKFADRVIEDACGIANFCSTVLSSKRPLTAILRAVRGPRGDVIMRFFNASLHDARIEMVMVLAEATKLRVGGAKSSRQAHEYLMKLYRKAIKRTVRLITGSKSKESYKNMYRSLRTYAQMDSYDSDDDDDEDDDDSYFDNLGEFGDSEFAEASLDAYRSGKAPTVIPVDKRGLMATDLVGNEEIMREISAVEAKIGRHLTDAELDQLLCGDDDDEVDVETVTKGSDKMIDEIVDVIYDRLIEKLGVKAPANETLDEYIDRQEKIAGEEVPLQKTIPAELIGETFERPTAISDNLSLETLVDTHNKMNAFVEVGGSKSETAEESDDDDSSHLPPVDSTGGNELGTDDKKLERVMYVNDILRDFDIFINSEIEKMDSSIRTNLDLAGFDFVDVHSTIVPAGEVELLLKMCTTVRISGDYETVNDVHLQMIMNSCIKRIAERLEIGEDYIGAELDIVDSSDSFDSEITILNAMSDGVKKYSRGNICGLNLKLCALAYYIHKEFGKNKIELRYINDPKTKGLMIYFYPKDPDTLEGIFRKFYEEDLIGWGVLEEIFSLEDEVASLMRGSGIYPVSYQLAFDPKDSTFIDDLKKIISTDPANQYCKRNIDYIRHCIGELGKDSKGCNIYTTNDVSTTPTAVSADLIYRIATGAELTYEEKREIEERLSINGDCQIRLRDMYRAISRNVIVEPYYMYTVIDDVVEDEDEPEEVVPVKTSRFGI